MTFEVGPAGESAMRLIFSEPPQPALTRKLLSIQDTAQQYFSETLIDSVIGYTTLTLFFTPFKFERDRAEAWLREQADNPMPETSRPDERTEQPVILPAFYHPSVAPDLEWLADDTGLSVDDVIRLHCEQTYFAYATGFAPGFCYLGNVDSRLVTPRLNTPRPQVPAGAVAIADSQTAVYPCDSPGGWRLIGACPERLFTLESTPPSKLSVGDFVRFEPISEADFYSMSRPT